MPSYFYHLKFELYPTPTPTPGDAAKLPKPDQGPIWLPGKAADIFDNLPTHPRTREAVPPHGNRAPRNWQQDRLPTSRFKVGSGVIDCGAPRPPESRDGRNIVRLSEVRRRQRTHSIPPPRSHAAINPHVATKDWRFGQLRIESIDADSYHSHDNMQRATTAAAAAVGPSMGGAGKATKAKYVPLNASKTTELGWGIVHLYREETESPGLTTPLDHMPDADEVQDGTHVDCTTICIPAVPSYLSPSDFLGFVGDRWRDQVSHYRMIMTGRMSRYLVLMKFRDSKQARFFGREFDGKVFNDIEPETCTVAFIRSVTFESPTSTSGSFPDLSQDPFTPSPSATSNSLKPFPPPTPNLIELPTCPVCLERMDDTTGLLTIPCQHVFHCSCLQKWKGSGCPVCRHTNPTLSGSSNSQYSSSSSPALAAPYDPNNPFAQPFGSRVSNLCSVCDSTDDLWICLICGNVGCGRYKGGHAKEHWKETAHTFSLELETQHVWDYAGDMWVHRLIRDKGDGKVVELPGRQAGPGDHEDQDVVPRAKLESIGMEYTHLLSSQLESQRVYFEEMLSKAADKAAKASAAAETAAAQASQALEELRALREEHRQLRTHTVPSLERDLERERNRAAKSTELARGLGKSLQEEKKVSEGLMERIEHVNKELESLGGQVRALEAENADLKDQNHDLSMFISGQEKLKELEASGTVEESEIQEGSVAVPEESRRRKKGKGKAKS
ncbi:zf-UBP-domain-containing protein [Durotheca rogersii]|uniref:zf-UBP-domain-containing protein n=1 Tax=Durotheca rogersii TaxID=419775 RepID=UPI00221F0F33|nr:zf-UBP-domain-containing protein [Durotheca rogersii]KAI5866222.1 zf-UBP-domain-containing protein [Durotheca rogersii]